jgi:hypothetical protein
MNPVNSFGYSFWTPFSPPHLPTIAPSVGTHFRHPEIVSLETILIEFPSYFSYFASNKYLQ